MITVKKDAVVVCYATADVASLIDEKLKLNQHRALYELAFAKMNYRKVDAYLEGMRAVLTTTGSDKILNFILVHHDNTTYVFEGDDVRELQDRIRNSEPVHLKYNKVQLAKVMFKTRAALIGTYWRIRTSGITRKAYGTEGLGSRNYDEYKGCIQAMLSVGHRNSNFRKAWSQLHHPEFDQAVWQAVLDLVDVQNVHA